MECVFNKDAVKTVQVRGCGLEMWDSTHPPSFCPFTIFGLHSASYIPFQFSPSRPLSTFSIFVRFSRMSIFGSLYSVEELMSYVF